MIEVRITQKEVIEHIKDSCMQHELSDFIMELTNDQSREFNCAMIKRFYARENLHG